MRLQLALNVRDLDRAIEFYSKMFATEPATVRPGYANFAIAEPPLKLVLFEQPTDDVSGASDDDSAFHHLDHLDHLNHLNHLGVEVEDERDVVAAEERLSAGGLDTTGVDDTQCCYARKTETWVTSPEGARWEWYVRHGDSEQFASVSLDRSDDTCCG